MSIDVNNEVAKRALLGESSPIVVSSADWPEACRQAFESELIDNDAPEFPSSDDSGWYPLVYRCQSGEWRGNMERKDGR